MHSQSIGVTALQISVVTILGSVKTDWAHTKKERAIPKKMINNLSLASIELNLWF